MKGMKGAGILTLVFLIISAIIGLVIIDAVATDASQIFTQVDELTITKTAQNQSIVTLTLSNSTAFTSIVQGANTLPAANYTAVRSPCCSVNLTNLSGTIWNSTAANFTYRTAKSSYFDSSLSRTIVGYVVPIGMLGVLGLAAMSVI